MNSLFMPKAEEQKDLEDLVSPKVYFDGSEVIVYAQGHNVFTLKNFDSEPELIYTDPEGEVNSLFFNGGNLYASSNERVVEVFSLKQSPLSPYGNISSVTGYGDFVIGGCDAGGLINFSKGYTLRCPELYAPISALCYHEENGCGQIYAASGGQVIGIDPLHDGHMRLTMDCVVNNYNFGIGALYCYDDQILVALNDPASGRNCVIRDAKNNIELTKRGRHVKSFFEFDGALYDVCSDGGINRSIKGNEVYHVGGNNFRAAVVVPANFLEKKR